MKLFYEAILDWTRTAYLINRYTILKRVLFFIESTYEVFGRFLKERNLLLDYISSNFVISNLF